MWLSIVIDGVNILNDFMDSLEIFQKDNRLRYNVTDFFMMLNLNAILNFFLKIDSNKLAEIIYTKLQEEPRDCSRVFAHLITLIKRIIVEKQDNNEKK